MGLAYLQEEERPRALSLSPSHVRTHREKALSARQEFSPETQRSGTLILDF